MPDPSRLSGRVLFARYAYPPNELGYCGTGDGAELLGVAAAGASRAAGPDWDVVGSRAGGFDGAWAYLQILAEAAGGLDPLDERAVEAYWIGNELLEAVDPDRFAAAARQRFAGQPGADWECLDAAPGAAPWAHHSFHVLAVYPWMSLLRRGGPGPALHVLDRCRIRWGEVVDVDGDHVEVRSPLLEWRNDALSLGPAVAERARWSADGQTLAGGVQVGDQVALHWDWVCDVLSERQLAALQRATARQLEATNASTTRQLEAASARGATARSATGAANPSQSDRDPI